MKIRVTKSVQLYTSRFGKR